MDSEMGNRAHLVHMLKPTLVTRRSNEESVSSQQGIIYQVLLQGELSTALAIYLNLNLAIYSNLPGYCSRVVTPFAMALMFL